jgi:hypothetical protein
VWSVKTLWNIHIFQSSKFFGQNEWIEDYVGLGKYFINRIIHKYIWVELSVGLARSSSRPVGRSDGVVKIARIKLLRGTKKLKLEWVSRGGSFILILLLNFDENCRGVRLDNKTQSSGSQFVNHPTCRRQVAQRALYVTSPRLRPEINLYNVKTEFLPHRNHIDFSYKSSPTKIIRK